MATGDMNSFCLSTSVLFGCVSLSLQTFFFIELQQLRLFLKEERNKNTL